jgi:hypothetical protein
MFPRALPSAEVGEGLSGSKDRARLQGTIGARARPRLVKVMAFWATGRNGVRVWGGG